MKNKMDKLLFIANTLRARLGLKPNINKCKINNMRLRYNFWFILELIILVLVHYSVSYCFRKFCSLDAFPELIINDVVVLIIAFSGSSLITLQINTTNTKYKDAIKLAILIVVLLIVGGVAYRRHFALYSYVILTTYVGYFFIFKRFVLFLLNSKKIIKSFYDNCDVDLILEDNFSNIQEYLITNIARKYKIRNILNFSDFNARKFCGKVYKTLEDYENSFLNFRTIFCKKNIRKLIYIAAAPNQDRIKRVLKLSVEFNMQLLRTSYLENLANLDSEHVSLTPFTFKDFEVELSLSVENKYYLINNFRNKNIWISYNGEDIIFEFIRHLAKAGSGMIQVFVSSEVLASKVAMMLSDFKALVFAINFLPMSEVLENTQVDSPDWIIHTTEINDQANSLDNFTAIVKKNFLEVKQIKDASDKRNVEKFVLITDLNNAKCASWVNVTQRLAEYYLKLGDTTAETIVVRMPKISFSLSALDEFLISQLSTRGVVAIPKAMSSNYLTNGLFNLFVAALGLSREYKQNILHVNPSANEATFHDLIELLLNTKGLKFSNEIEYYDERRRVVDEFPPMEEQIIETSANGIAVLKTFVGKERKELENLSVQISKLLNTNSIPEMINVCMQAARSSIS